MISSSALVSSWVNFSNVKCLLSPAIIIIAFWGVILLISSSVLVAFGMFWSSVRANVWVKVSAGKGVWSESALMMATLLKASALVFACMSRLSDVSMPTVSLACLAMWLKRSPVPHPASSMMALLFMLRFSRAAAIFVSCSSVYCVS